MWGSKGYSRAGRCSSCLCVQSCFDTTQSLSLATVNTSRKEFVPLPSLLNTETLPAAELCSLSPEQNGSGEVKSRLVDFIRMKKQSKTKKQTQTSFLSSLPCYESAFTFRGLLTIFQDGTSHTVSSGTADIVSAGRQLLCIVLHKDSL